MRFTSHHQFRPHLNGPLDWLFVFCVIDEHRVVGRWSGTMERLLFEDETMYSKGDKWQIRQSHFYTQLPQNEF